jgi:hypothetical protein
LEDRVDQHDHREPDQDQAEGESGGLDPFPPAGQPAEEVADPLDQAREPPGDLLGGDRRDRPVVLGRGEDRIEDPAERVGGELCDGAQADAIASEASSRSSPSFRTRRS